jgi:hypothetical protein
LLNNVDSWIAEGEERDDLRQLAGGINMKKWMNLTVLLFLIGSIALMTPAFSLHEGKASLGPALQEIAQGPKADQPFTAQDKVILTLYVLDGNSGEILPGVAVSALDASGNRLEGETDSNGAVALSGQPGIWQITLNKEGYQKASSNYDVTKTLMAATGLSRAAQPQEQVDLTLYVHEGDLNGTLLSGVQIAGQDAAGNSFQASTDSTGAATISGLPGRWQFTFQKEGYETLDLSYNVTESEEAAAYLLQAAQPQEQVDLTLYVHEGDLNGSLLSGVQIAGQDAAGNSFQASTGSTGAATISGLPGRWQFTFQKEGYETLNLSYDITQTEEADTYLTRAAQPREQVDLTVYVHEGDLNGTFLSGVQIAGQDAAGNSFQASTGSTGAATISGLPGRWQFTFEKEGYETLDLSYNVTESEEAAAYLSRATQPRETIVAPETILPSAPTQFQFPYPS